MARPCASCMGLIRKLGIRYINYTTEDGIAVCILDFAVHSFIELQKVKEMINQIDSVDEVAVVEI